MSNLWLVLGQQRLLEADQTTLPALSGLCRALGLRAHWDEAGRTLYIASPLAGRRLVIDIRLGGSPPYGYLAEAIAARLKQQVEAAGGLVSLDTGGDLCTCDLLLRLSVGRLRSWGVAASYRWLCPEFTRTAATLLSSAVAEAAAMPCLGARLSLAGSRQKGALTVEIEIGRPDETNAERIQSETLPTQVADGLYQGLVRLWSPPVAAPELPSESAEPPPPAPKPVLDLQRSPEELGIEVEYVQPVADPGDDAPRIVLFADYSVVHEPPPPPAPEAAVAPQPEPEPAPAQAWDPPAFEPEPPPPLEPTPTPELATLMRAPAPDPSQPLPDPTPAPAEARLVLTKPAGTPISFKFMPLSDPRVVPGATNVVVFQREAPRAAPAKPKPRAPEPSPAPQLQSPVPAPEPLPQPALTVLEEFLSQPQPQTPTPEPAPPALPERVVTVRAHPPKQRFLKEVRVIQGGATIIRRG